MKSMNIAVVTALVLSATCAVPVIASDNPGATPLANEMNDPRKAEPFKGKVEAVDQDAKTFTVGDKQYSINEDTKLSNQGKETTFAELKVGELVRGIAQRAEDGKLVATFVMLGIKES